MIKAVTYLCVFGFVGSLHGIISFDDAMSIHKVIPPKISFTQELMPIARVLYNRFNPERIEERAYPVIPRIIHHVWFGVPLSDQDKQLRATWQQFHPDYRFILWTDRIDNDPDALCVRSWQELDNALLLTNEQFIVVDVATLAFDNRRFFDEAINYGEKSDILKYEIVYQVGGMYVDFDFECLKPFDDLFGRYDFFTGIQPLDTNVEQLGAALFASKPNHPILRHAVETIKDDHQHKQIIIKTGPIHFSQAFIAKAGSEDNLDIAFPASYFYPYGYQQQGQPRSAWMRSDSYAVHHWSGSWLKAEAFAPHEVN